MNFSEIMEFRGTWRKYQARVLRNAQHYGQDGHIHIVAAPGSGKTTLGIEMIIRLSEPVLILAPSITIREQWITRIQEAFLKDGVEGDRYLSQDLKSLKLVTVATYQALHSAMTRFSGRLVETAEGPEEEGSAAAAVEEVDYTGFDLTAAMQRAGIGVLCLDECHHLRSEWWKSLEELKKSYEASHGGLKTIALTATPPYDSTPAMWTRYMNLCGEIDEEITIPELVREGSLCPHQDYVYFNYPTREETDTIEEFEAISHSLFETLMEEEAFASAIRTHKLMTGEAEDDQLLDYPEYLASILIYLEQKGISYPARLKSLLGARRLPRMNEKWMGILLQGFLYDDCDAYYCDKAYREELTGRLKAAGLIEKRKVCMTASERVEKLLIQSKGKSNSIRDIVFGEYRSMGQQLRMLVLTDYIRRETERTLGTGEEINTLGVLPFFEMLRLETVRRKESIRLGVLCGSVVILPAEARDALLAAAGENGSRISFSQAGQLDQRDYVKVTAGDNAHFLTAAVTEVFAQGYLQVLIGTKSLLGEGWDSPCINSLILASFVGSYMLSNQMRGRAIRVLKGHPDKTSNIWHLVCLKPKQLRSTGPDSQEESGDYKLLVRRMEQFLGLHYEEDYIENGIERLSVIKQPFTKSAVAGINKQMLAMASGRETLRNRWRKALEIHNEMQVVEETEVEDKQVTVVALFNAIRMAAISAVCTILGLWLCLPGITGGNVGGLQYLAGAAAVISGIVLLTRLPKIIQLGTPLGRLQAFGEGIRKAIAGRGMFEIEQNRCVTDQAGALVHAVYLSGGSGRDKALFARCVFEFFGEVDNQRYLLVRKKHRNRMDGYFCVPECFARKKEDAEYFAACMKPYAGEYEPVYTRNKEGRALLLEGRIKALANQQNRCITRKKVKGALE